jgi:murein DD-endopeptidase MepM/ murein hydrolase activator NlpD
LNVVEELDTVSKPQLTTKKQVRLRQTLALVTVGLVSAVSFNGWQHKVVAVEATPSQTVATTVRVNQGWQAASFPVENFQAYTSPFGYRSSATGGGGQEFHRGLDLAAPEGSYIRSWWTGRVVEVSDDSACGTSVVIQSGDWQHIYCHMKGRVETANGGRYMVDRDGGVQIWEGQMVPAGARIGRVGMTGRTTGPHLHWGLKHAGQWVDPAVVLKEMYSQQVASRSVYGRSQ